ncbi:MAG TPA: DUF4288 domain-containing protein [Cyclobacteriaceae bacterium]|nr:DUF4288 domain-containing protein [Cyclobacteriaceae bacterium]
MNWYIAKIVFRICNEGSQHLQFDEHIRLIAADNFDEAFLKARILGISEEDAFLNDRNKPVKWEFINVAELFLIKELKDGSEIYSTITEKEEASNYVHTIHQRAIFMQTKERPLF